MIYNSFEQGSDDWKSARMGVATASQFKRVMGGKGGDMTYMYELISQRLTGIAKELYFLPAVDHGSATEAQAMATYEVITGYNVHHLAFMKLGEYFGYSPDGLVDESGLVEIKCPDTCTFIKWRIDGGVPKEHLYQLLGALWVTGREWLDFVYFDPRMPTSHTVFIIRVTADAYKYEIEKLGEKLLDFKARLIGNLEIFKQDEGE